MKDEILHLLRQQVFNDLELAKASLKSSETLAKSDEMKPDSKWDTRAIEAAYLAGAQDKRVKELEQYQRVLNDFRTTSSEQVTIGSLVTTQFEFEEKTFFISPSIGGLKLQLSKEITVLTPQSPLAKKFIGLEEGDEIEFQLKGQQVLILILNID